MDNNYHGLATDIANNMNIFAEIFTDLDEQLKNDNITERDYLESMEYYIKELVSNYESSVESYEYHNRPADTPEYAELMDAAIKGDLKKVKELIEQGVDFRYRKDEVLVRTAQRGHTNIVQLLIEKGADVHAQHDYAIGLAAMNNHIDTMSYLLGKGADPFKHDDIVMWTANHGQTEALKILLELGLSPNDGESDPIICAAYGGHKDCVKLLIQYGADFHTMNDDIVRNSGLDLEFIKELCIENNIKFPSSLIKVVKNNERYGDTWKVLKEINATLKSQATKR